MARQDSTGATSYRGDHDGHIDTVADEAQACANSVIRRASFASACDPMIRLAILSGWERTARADSISRRPRTGWCRYARASSAPEPRSAEAVCRFGSFANVDCGSPGGMVLGMGRLPLRRSSDLEAKG